MDRFDMPMDDGLELFVEGICDKCPKYPCNIISPLAVEGCNIVKQKVRDVEKRNTEFEKKYWMEV